jgi:hypothetical protein
MPMHDWTRVEAGIYHAFHHRWISAISDVLNTGLLPKDYYALPEQVAAGFGPDMLTLQEEAEAEFYRRKKSAIAVHHVSGDRIVAIIEIVSPGNKSNRHAFRAFVDKAASFWSTAFTCSSSTRFLLDPAIPTAFMRRFGKKWRTNPFSFRRTSRSRS